MKQPDVHSPLFKVALLSASLLLSDAGAVSPTLPYLEREFPGVAHATIQSFITVPAMAGVAATLLAGIVAGRIGKRRLLLSGIVLLVIGGLAPLVLISTGQFGLVMASRLLVGVGIGFLQPLSASLIADFYRGRERGTMMGWQSSMVGLGGVIWSLIVAALMTLGWQAAFFVYLAALVIFGLFWRFVPEPTRVASGAGLGLDAGIASDAVSVPDAVGAPTAVAAPAGSVTPAATAPAATKSPIPWSTLPAALLVMAMTLGYQAIIISTPFLAIEEKHLTDGAGVSLIMTTFSLASVTAGVVFGPLSARLANWTPTAALVVLASGLTLAGTTAGLPQLYAGAILVGLGFGTYMPFALTAANEQVAQDRSAIVTALVFIGMACGSFVAPHFFAAVAGITGNHSASGQFATGAVTIGLVLVAATVFYQVQARRSTSGNSAKLNVQEVR